MDGWINKKVVTMVVINVEKSLITPRTIRYREGIQSYKLIFYSPTYISYGFLCK